MRHLSNSRGISLVEVLIAMTIGVIIMSTAAPFYGDYVRNSRLREAGNMLMSEALLAQSEAVKRNTTVRLSINGATVRVIDRSTPGADVILRERAFTGNVSAPAANVDFGSKGRPVPFGTNGSINLSMLGSTCSSELRCPGFRVDAGGAIRLCSDHLSACG